MKFLITYDNKKLLTTSNLEIVVQYWYRMYDEFPEYEIRIIKL